MELQGGGKVTQNHLHNAGFWSTSISYTGSECTNR